jgi:hypothetical protein
MSFSGGSLDVWLTSLSSVVIYPQSVFFWTLLIVKINKSLPWNLHYKRVSPWSVMFRNTALMHRICMTRICILEIDLA